MSTPNYFVCVIMGSASDHAVLQHGIETLKQLQIPTEVHVASAHRSPAQVRDIVQQADQQGCRAFIAGAGLAAHLAGMIAAHTDTPVIGVPLDGALQGMDSLLSTVQMPPGCPVACMAIGRPGATNAAIFAAQIIATSQPEVHQALRTFKAASQQKRAQQGQAIEQQYARHACTTD